MKIEAVIFDMDGVLVDTEPFYMYRVRQFLDSHHIKVSMQDVYRLAGSSQKEILKSCKVGGRPQFLSRN
ncbi:HAD hydrolase-like protein [Breznakia sp. PFB1-11]|uniref:HAD hydrolase-like protein n=1 Tax=Breznakia sp. PFB1-11 TaxID=2940521 RepID=UPI003F8D8EAE